MSLQTMKAKYIEAKNAYYNSTAGKTVMSDAQFDALEDRIRKLDPTWSELKKTGVKVGKKTEVPLRVPMPSLDKVKADNPKADSILTKIQSMDEDEYSVGVSAKLDGGSLQANYEGGKLVSLATRGDGEIGKNVSHFIPYIPDAALPKKIAFRGHFTVRLEAVLETKVFAKKWAKEFDSARATASALFNRQTVHPAMNDLHLVVLRVLDDNGKHPALVDGWNKAAKLGFEVVQHKELGSIPSASDLSIMLDKLRSRCPYETDGLVVASNAPNLPQENERPSWAKAFKVDDHSSAPTATIQDIVWSVSSFGVIVPKAIISPTKFGNVTVKQAAIHNPRWAMERGVGIGAEVRVIRSGEIIPKIIEVLKPAKFSFPKKAEFGAYEWDENEVNIVLSNKKDSIEVKAKTLQRAFVHLGMDQCGPSLAEALVEAGIDSPQKLFRVTDSKIRSLDLPGIGNAKKSQLIAAIAAVKSGSVTLDKIAVASGFFDKGVGTTRIRTLQESLPQLLKSSAWTRENKAASKRKIEETEGLRHAFAQVFAEGAHSFLSWLEQSDIQVAKPKAKRAVDGGKLSGKHIAWTGYRNKDEEAAVEAAGGIVSKFDSKTDVLLFNPNGKDSSKPDKARERGIKVMTWSQFQKLL